jgi:UDP-GlcNAc3NAcA epimerase
MKIVTIVGARPQFIKAAAVSRALRAKDQFTELIVHTGQHFDANMSEVFFAELAIPHPDFNLGIGGGTHGQNTGRMLEAIEDVLLQVRPDWVLVYGDTDSTLAGTLAAAKLHIPIAHVEAGLRSFNRGMPEEINRVLTDHAADLLFTPTDAACRNLAHEGISGSRIARVGDVMYDAALHYGALAEQHSTVLQRLGLSQSGYVLATIHRQENTDAADRLTNILRGLADSEWPVVLPLHPRTRQRIAALPQFRQGSLQLIDPVGYLDMIMLEKNARLIATDSGGVQKEACFHRVPCLTLRDETEWVELIEIGANRLVGAAREAIRSAINQAVLPAVPATTLYGDGQASIVIADMLATGRPARPQI